MLSCRVDPCFTWQELTLWLVNNIPVRFHQNPRDIGLSWTVIGLVLYPEPLDLGNYLLYRVVPITCGPELLLITHKTRVPNWYRALPIYCLSRVPLIPYVSRVVTLSCWLRAPPMTHRLRVLPWGVNQGLKLWLVVWPFNVHLREKYRVQTMTCGLTL